MMNSEKENAEFNNPDSYEEHDCAADSSEQLAVVESTTVEILENDELAKPEEDEFVQQTRFLELLKYEEESKAYLEQLDKEEAELKRKVEEQMRKNHSLMENNRTLEAKIEAQRKYRESLGVAKLTEENDKKEREVERMRAEAVSLRTKIVEKSSNMLKLHAQDVDAMNNRFKRFWNPDGVVKEYEETKENISKLKDAVQKKEHLEGEIRRYQEQQNINKMIKMISEEVKAAAETEKKAVEVLKKECGLLEEELGLRVVQNDQLNRQ